MSIPNNELKPCPLCGVAVDSGPTGGIYIHHPIDSKNPWACNMANADIRVADWQNRPGEDAARLKQFEEDCKIVSDLLGFDPEPVTSNELIHIKGYRRGVEHAEEAIRHAWKERHDN